MDGGRSRRCAQATRRQSSTRATPARPFACFPGFWRRSRSRRGSAATSRSRAGRCSASSTPLAEMGASIEARDGKFPPLTIHGRPLHGIDYTLPVASAQVKSCVLLAGLFAEGRHHRPRAGAHARSHRNRAAGVRRGDRRSKRRVITLRDRRAAHRARAGGSRRSQLGRIFPGRRAADAGGEPGDSWRGAESDALRAARFSGGDGRVDQGAGCAADRRRADRRSARARFEDYRRRDRRRADGGADRRNSGAGGAGRGVEGRADGARRRRAARQGNRPHRHA